MSSYNLHTFWTSILRLSEVPHSNAKGKSSEEFPNSLHCVEICDLAKGNVRNLSLDG